MTTQKIITSIFMMIAALAVFMFGLKTMSDRLEAQASGGVRKLFAKATSNKFKGMAVGFGVTAAIQSSSASTVMVVGLVNAGMLTLAQATTIIIGANIGSTVTALIISLPITEVIAAAGALIGIILLFSSKARVKNVGYIVISLGLIFFGLAVMSDGMRQIASLGAIRNFFESTTHPFLLFLLGLGVTAAIQSSAATTGILISLGGAGLIGLESALFVIIGMNIGTCVTALLASIGTNINAVRSVGIHLLFNFCGAALFGSLLSIPAVRVFAVRLIGGVGRGFPDNGIAAQIALFHIIFNVTTAAILLPLADYIVKACVKLLPERKGRAKKEHRLEFLNEVTLDAPAAAVAQAKKEILRMTDMAKTNLDIAVKAVSENVMPDMEDFEKREKYLDWLNQQIPYYLTKILSHSLSYTDGLIISSFYHVVSDVERIGDYSENLIQNNEKLLDGGFCFSDTANREIMDMYHKILELYSICVDGFERGDLSAQKRVGALDKEIGAMRIDLSDAHIKRLNDGICTAQTGAVYLSIVSNLKRISDHMRNIFYSMRKYVRRPQP